jgi:hypothetical protein
MEATTMERLTHPKQLALAVLLGAAVALGAAPGVAAQDAAEVATTYTGEEATTTASPDTMSSASSARAPETIIQFVEGPALDTRPVPGDAFPTDQWGNTE